MKEKIENGHYLTKYFTQFPNIIDDSDLSPFEFRLLLHYYRVGECWEGVRTTAEKCHMSVGKVSDCRKTLQTKGFITVEYFEANVSIKVVDKGRENIEKYCSPHEHPVHVTTVRRSPHEQDRSQGELKNNQLRITNEEEPLPYGELFRIGWQYWLEYKKQRRDKFPDTTRKLQLKKLAGFGDEQLAIASLNKSMENGWQGLFDPRDAKAATAHRSNSNGFVE